MTKINPHRLTVAGETYVSLTARCSLCLGSRVTESGNPCPDCKGHGVVITASGRQLLEFLNWWSNRPVEKA